MRAVNLIPPEQRRGERAPLRSGPASYVVVGALAAILAVVTLLVLTNNQIADHESQKAQLEAQKAAAEQEVRELAPYAEFASLQETRKETISSLAESRFDWERVLRELAIVLPDDVWLIELAGTVTPEVQLESSPSITARASIPGPALELVGCGATQDSVARFVAALEDIDGVTRVGVDESKRPDLSSTQATAQSGEGSTEECRTRDQIARFQIVAAFDAAAVPPTAEGTVPTDPATAPPAPATGEEGGEEADAGDGQSADAEQGSAKGGVASGVVR
jgi:Tfp pilus assembly protein PilN